MTAAIGRADQLGLALVSAVLLVLLGAAASHWPLSIDESWHIYFAEVGPWRKALGEWAHDTHPPLSYLLMRPLVGLGDGPLWPRLASVVPTAVQPWLLFVVLRRLAVDRTVAWCAVLAAAPALPTVALGVSVRSYALATTAGGVALAAVLGMQSSFGGPTPARLRVAGLGAVAAVWSLVAAWAWFAAAAVAAVSWAVIRPRSVAGAGRAAVGSCSRVDLAAFAIGMLGAAAFVVLAVIRTETSHVGRWMAGPDESFGAFVLRGLGGWCEAFTVHGSSSAVVGFAIAGVAGAGWVVWRSSRSTGAGADARAILAIGALVLAVLLALAGWIGAYPFGGDMRHQYVAFPALVLLLTLVVDEVVRSFRARAVRRLVPIMVAAAALWAGAIRSPRPPAVEFPAESLWTDAAASLFGADDDTAVVMPNLGFVGVYGVERSRGWRFVERLGSWDLFEVARPPRRVYRHRNVWSLPALPDARFLEALRELCVACGETHVRLWTARLDGPPDAAGRPGVAAAWRDRLAEHGFVLSGRAATSCGEVLEVSRR